MMKKKEDAIILFSGGLDSTICLYWALETFNKVHVITFDYGQTNKSEIKAAVKIAMATPTPVATGEIASLRDILHSVAPIVDASKPMPIFKDRTEINIDEVASTFVPMRNALFLVVAANRAVELGCKNIVIGVDASARTNYPDVRKRFVKFQEVLTNVALGYDGIKHRDKCITIHAPIAGKEKAREIQWALGFRGCYAMLGWTVSGYTGEFPPITRDYSTVMREEGFAQAGLPDPLIVRAYWEVMLPLPATDNYWKFQEEIWRAWDEAEKDVDKALMLLERKIISHLREEALSWILPPPY